MSAVIQLKYTAVAEDYGEVNHVMMAGLALAEALLSNHNVKNRLTSLRGSPELCLARAQGPENEVSWCQQQSNALVMSLFGFALPWLEKIIAIAIAHDISTIVLTATPTSSMRVPQHPTLETLSASERAKVMQEYRAASKAYKEQSSMLGRMPRPDAFMAFPRYANWYVRHVLQKVPIKQLVEAEECLDGYQPSGRHDVQRGIDRISYLLGLPARPHKYK